MSGYCWVNCRQPPNRRFQTIRPLVCLNYNGCLYLIRIFPAAPIESVVSVALSAKAVDADALDAALSRARPEAE
jgi:hypothetical protein